MKRRFLALICLLYFSIISYVLLSNNLKNFLAPTMQIYIKISALPLLFMGVVLLIYDKGKYKFKISDLVLLLPLIMIVFASDGRLTTTLASNRMQKINIEKKNINKIIENNEEDLLEDDIEEYDFSKVDFDVKDSTYFDLTDYFSSSRYVFKEVGKTIRVKGFITEYYSPEYFVIGKYAVTCCTADSSFAGFVSKYDTEKIKYNNWYEIEGVLKKGKDNENNDIIYIKIVNIKEIDSKKEEQYVYPCFSYDDKTCSEVLKYNLEY